MDDYRLAESNEQALLGAILADPSLIGDVNDIINGQDFYFQRHSIIYNAAVYRFMCGEAVDVITLGNFLRDSNKLDIIGGVSYLSELVDVTPDVANALSYAEAVKQYALSRGVKQLCTHLAAGLERRNARELIDEGMAELIRLSESATDSNQVPVGNIVDRAVDKLIAVHEGSREEQKYVYTGFSQLDRITAGLKPKDMLVLASRPSVGKTALATNIAVNVARSNNPVLFFSLEMDKERLIYRMLAAETGVPYRLIESGMLKNEHIEKLRVARDIFNRLPIFIDDSSKQSLAGIRTKVRRQMARTGLSLVIVDYLQLACGDNREEIALWSKGLKAIAKDVDITMMPLAQLNRYVEHRDDRRPIMSDLAGSSQIEQDADILGFIWHPKDSDKLFKMLSIEKHRNGPLGDIEFNFNNATTKFTERGIEVKE